MTTAILIFAVMALVIWNVILTIMISNMVSTSWSMINNGQHQKEVNELLKRALEEQQKINKEQLHINKLQFKRNLAVKEVLERMNHKI
jgi:hypothetical protein